MRPSSRATATRMPLVERVLEILRAGLPAFDFDEARWLAVWLAQQRRAGQAPRAASRGIGTEARRRAAPARPRRPGAAAVAADPVLKRCYARLEVAYGASPAEVRSAWKRLVREHHPDLHAAEPDRQRRQTEQIQEINSSYEELSRRLEELA